MWGLTRLFKRSPRRDDLNGLTWVTVNGHKFQIRKINPFLDFPSDKMPQIFSYYMGRKKPPEPEKLAASMTEAEIRKNLEDMKMIVSAGVTWPKLGPEILTIDDIFRWGDTGYKLYLEIFAHALNHFKGIRGVFFSIKIRRLLYTNWRNNTAGLLRT